jgi:hypothetical protein
MSTVSTSSSGAPLTTVLKGINIVRLNCYGYNSPSYYQDFINQMTANKIVVEIEDHTTSDGSDGGGGSGDIFTGSLLTQENNWYAALATAYANNPYVWFGTDNEPPYTDLAGLTAWQVSTYNAIRGTGAKNIILIEEPGGGVPGTIGAGCGETAASYATMTNIVWDYHFYGWVANYSTDVSTIQSVFTGSASSCTGIVAAQTIKSADGIVPVIVGEYGISTDGTNVDANGTQVVSVVDSSGYGSMAWGWNTGPSDNLTDGSNNLTTYGQQVEMFILNGP